MAAHRPVLVRIRLGRQPYGQGSYLYGTVVRCACGDWQAQVNQAPSAGGNAEAMRRWWEHYAEHLASLEGHYWRDLSLRLRRQFCCLGYTAKGEACAAGATRRYGPEHSGATTVLCTPHARLAGDS